ncbi:hypothetical protein CC2G_014681 [Coprinopsis cinerea AmutBmut pab1-1]|nr:hypothetical protein CC2G_014681 [Coprinopsis cinerea AmutBmut pab1-1]
MGVQPISGRRRLLCILTVNLDISGYLDFLPIGIIHLSRSTRRAGISNIVEQVFLRTTSHRCHWASYAGYSLLIRERMEASSLPWSIDVS